MRSAARTRWLIGLLCGALLLAVAPATDAATPHFKPFRVHGQPMRSVMLSDTPQFASLSIPDFPRLANDGVNTITIYVYQFLRGPSSSTLEVDPLTEPDSSLIATIEAAHAQGLSVQLIPTVWVNDGLANSGTYVWRGRIHPDDLWAFFASYRVMVNHYAELAAAHGVELYGVGSEMASLEKYTSQWRQTISEARQRYKGPVTYFTVWKSVSSLSWWNLVDYPGMSAYLSLSSNAVPGYDEVASAWRKVHLPFIRRLTAKVGKPLLISEIGYMAVAGAATHPEQNRPGAVQEQLQADLYRAALSVLMRDRAVDGISFHRWSAYQAGPADNSFSPKGKLAECELVRAWAPGGHNAASCLTVGRLVV